MKRLGITYDKEVVLGVVDDRTDEFKREQVITEDFKKCVVRFCSEVVEFEVNGMKFRATCERID